MHKADDNKPSRATKNRKKLTSLEAAAIRWKNSHCDQLKDGVCPDCTALWKAIAKYMRSGK